MYANETYLKLDNKSLITDAPKSLSEILKVIKKEFPEVSHEKIKVSVGVMNFVDGGYTTLFISHT